MAQTILVAAHELRGGTKKEPFILGGGEILTAKAQKSLGLDDDGVTDLVKRGDIVRQKVHEAGESAATSGPSGAEVEARVRGEMLGEIRAVLDEHGIAHEASMDAAALVRAALAAEKPDPIEATAAAIEKDMKADEMRAELDKLQVPYETDANKAALAKALAQARAAQG